MELTGKRIVIIGGASGIGRAVAEAALAEKASVVVASSNKAKVEHAAQALGAGAKADFVDVSQETDVAAFFDRVGSFDHLIFTAGDWPEIMRGGPIDEIDLDRARDIFAIRFWGALAAIKYARKYLALDGSITLTSGTVAHRPTPGSAINAAMAGAVEHVIRGLAIDLAPIRVNAVCPALVRTEIWDSLMGEHRDEIFRDSTARQPIARPGEPGEVAQAYLYLMRAGYTTGQVARADGGVTVV
mgnify:CR=1 FL=1